MTPRKSSPRLRVFGIDEKMVKRWVIGPTSWPQAQPQHQAPEAGGNRKTRNRAARSRLYRGEALMEERYEDAAGRPDGRSGHGVADEVIAPGRRRLTRPRRGPSPMPRSMAAAWSPGKACQRRSPCERSSRESQGRVGRGKGRGNVACREIGGCRRGVGVGAITYDGRFQYRIKAIGYLQSLGVHYAERQDVAAAPSRQEYEGEGGHRDGRIVPDARQGREGLAGYALSKKGMLAGSTADALGAGLIDCR